MSTPNEFIYITSKNADPIQIVRLDMIERFTVAQASPTEAVVFAHLVRARNQYAVGLWYGSTVEDGKRWLDEQFLRLGEVMGQR